MYDGNPANEFRSGFSIPHPVCVYVKGHERIAWAYRIPGHGGERGNRVRGEKPFCPRVYNAVLMGQRESLFIRRRRRRATAIILAPPQGIICERLTAPVWDLETHPNIVETCDIGVVARRREQKDGGGGGGSEVKMEIRSRPRGLSFCRTHIATRKRRAYIYTRTRVRFAYRLPASCASCHTRRSFFT